MSKMIISEAYFYLSSFLWGMALVAIYDVLRIFRRIIKHNKKWTVVEDLLFWITAAILIFRMIYQYNNGILRIPGMIILILGMIFYHYVVSNPFVGCLNRKIICPMKKTMGVFIKGLKKLVKKVRMEVPGNSKKAIERNDIHEETKWKNKSHQ
ncbi:MAG: spore cortex biosynthesis protein YabQ [Acetivibrio sp.]